MVANSMRSSAGAFLSVPPMRRWPPLPLPLLLLPLLLLLLLLPALAGTRDDPGRRPPDEPTIAAARSQLRCGRGVDPRAPERHRSRRVWSLVPESATPINATEEAARRPLVGASRAARRRPAYRGGSGHAPPTRVAAAACERRGGADPSADGASARRAAPVSLGLALVGLGSLGSLGGGGSACGVPAPSARPVVMLAALAAAQLFGPAVGQCESGRYLNAGNCAVCGPGQYQDATGHSETECKNCPAGKRLNSMGSDEITDCRDCAAGQYQDDAGEPACEFCPEGRYGPTGAADELDDCIGCVAGKFSTTTGATDGDAVCIDCAAGKYAPCEDTLADPATCNPARDTCTDCPAGRYGEDTANDS